MPQDVAGQLRAGVPARHGGARARSSVTSARARRSTGSSRSEPRTCTSRSAVLSPDAERLEAVRHGARTCAGGAAGRRADLAAGLLPAADRADVVRLQGRDRPAGDRGQRRSPPTNPTGAADQGRRVHSRLPGRDRLAAADAHTRRCSDETAPTSSFASSTLASPPTAGTSGRRPPSREDEALLGAKMVGRWQSGAPLVARPRRGRSRARRRRRAEQRLPLRR